jgi:hypothetical protein
MLEEFFVPLLEEGSNNDMLLGKTERPHISTGE